MQINKCLVIILLLSGTKVLNCQTPQEFIEQIITKHQQCEALKMKGFTTYKKSKENIQLGEIEFSLEFNRSTQAFDFHYFHQLDLIPMYKDISISTLGSAYQTSSYEKYLVGRIRSDTVTRKQYTLMQNLAAAAGDTGGESTLIPRLLLDTANYLYPLADTIELLADSIVDFTLCKGLRIVFNHAVYKRTSPDYSPAVKYVRQQLVPEVKFPVTYLAGTTRRSIITLWFDKEQLTLKYKERINWTENNVKSKARTWYTIQME